MTKITITEPNPNEIVRFDIHYEDIPLERK